MRVRGLYSGLIFLWVAVFLPANSVLANEQNQIAFADSLSLTNPDSAYQIVQHYLEDKGISTDERLNAYLIASNALIRSGRYREAETRLDESFQLVSDTHDQESEYLIKLAYSDLYKITQRYDQALQHLFSVLDYYESVHDNLQIANTYISIAELYRAIENFSMASEYISKAEELHFADSLPDSYAARLYHRASAIAISGYSDAIRAEELSKQSLKYSIRSHNLESMAISYNELGFIFLWEGSKGLDYFQKALAIWEKLGFKHYEANTAENMARAYLHNGQFDEALEMTERAKQIGLQNEIKGIYASALEIEGDILHVQGKYEQSYALLKESFDLQKEDYEAQFSLELAEHAESFENIENEKRILLQQNEIREAKIKAEERQSQNRYYLFILFVLIFIIAVISLFYIKINRVNKTLILQSDEIEEKNKNLVEVVSQKDALYRELHHRVKNNLSVLSGLLYLQQENAKNSEVESALIVSQNRIQCMALIHQNLYQMNDASKVNLQLFLDQLISNIQTSFVHDNLDVEIDLNCQKVSLEMLHAVPLGMILNELITNSFKYAFRNRKKGKIGVEYVVNQNEVDLNIFDDGEGLRDDFEKDKSKSLGMKLIWLLAEQIGGKVIYSKSQGMSRFTIRMEKEVFLID